MSSWYGCSASATIGVLNGNGPKRGSKCVVKGNLFNDNGKGNYTCVDDGGWRMHRHVSMTARYLAKSFNAFMRAPIITFQWPLFAHMDTVSCFTTFARIFRPHKKRLRQDEIVVVEDLIQVGFC